MKRNLITFGLLINSLFLFSQDDPSLKGQFYLSMDSLTDWSYDVVSNDRIDTNLICRIALFRNRELPDKLSMQTYGRGIRPLMIFNVYPVSMIDTVKKMSFKCRVFASCVPPNVGGDYYVLKDFVFINYSSCVDCAYANYKTDLCRANINRIISSIKERHYSSIDELLADLPIKKEELDNQ